MSYTKEMCLYLLEHQDIIEKESLTDYVEQVIFHEINKVIRMRIGDRSSWRTQYALVTGDDEGNDATWISGRHWPVKMNSEPLAFIRLWETEDSNYYWLSHALGQNGASLCFDFWAGAKPGGPSTYKIRKKMTEFYEKSEPLKSGGFLVHPRGTLFLPFALDVKVLKEEFPKLENSLAPLKSALEAVLSLKPEFDKLIAELFPL